MRKYTVVDTVADGPITTVYEGFDKNIEKANFVVIVKIEDSLEIYALENDDYFPHLLSYLITLGCNFTTSGVYRLK